MALQEQNLTITTPDGPMRAFLVQPEKPRGGKIRAVIVIQEAFGANHHIQEVCRRTAREGYLAIAPEMFHREGAGIEFSYDVDFSKIMPVFSKLTNAGVAMDIGAAIGFLESRFKLSSREIAVMGFCMGGLATMISATVHPIGGAIPYYGGGMVEPRPGLGLKPVIQDFPKIDCPLLFFFGDQDKSIPMEHVHAVEKALEAAGKKFELIVYPGAGHGFSNDERASYEPKATAASWLKTLSWLAALQ